MLNLKYRLRPLYIKSFFPWNRVPDSVYRYSVLS
uniref:Uncharacterized protein n=1 Tax=Arundo donax TaxID=35708 RepID=A0A0A9CDI2_ARUDO